MAAIRILIADDHTVVRQSLARLLDEEPDLEVIGEAINGRDAVEQVQELHPDVVLMDISMPLMNGVEATREITSSCPDVKVIGLSMHQRDSMSGTMLAAGAVGYVTKAAPVDELLATVRSAACETGA